MTEAADVKRTLSALEARRRLGELLEGVFYRGDEVVIERAGKPMAVVIPAERYQALEQSRQRLFAFIEQTLDKNKDASEAEVVEDIDMAVREVREAAGAQRQ